MSALKEQANLARYCASRCSEIFSKETFSEEDKVDIKTICALAVELIKSASAYKLREADWVGTREYLGIGARSSKRY